MAALDRREASPPSGRVRFVHGEVVERVSCPLAGFGGGRVDRHVLVVRKTRRLPVRGSRPPGAGAASAVVAYAATQLHLTLSECSFVELSVAADEQDLDDVHRWLLVETSEASRAERVVIRKVGESQYLAGSEERARIEFQQLIAGRVGEGTWPIVPENAAAVSATPQARSSTRGVKASVLALLVIFAAAVLGTLIPGELFGTLGELGQIWRMYAIAALSGLCGAYFAVRVSVWSRNGGDPTWADWAALTVFVSVPVLVVASVVSNQLGRGWALVTLALVLLVVASAVVFGRPSILVVRHKPARTAVKLLASVSLVVLVLNIPVSVFMFAAGVPQVLGPVPIGTVVASGVTALIWGGLLYASVVFGVRAARRNLAPTTGFSFATAVALVAALGLAFTVGNALQDGLLLGRSGTYTDRTLGYGIQPVCVHQPQPAQGGSFWLAGTAGRTSYLLPRFQRHETPPRPIQVDAAHELDYPGADGPCQAR
ncbi:hypothetical protein [Leifsonia xyli]|uniref:hypothetical protein n=1 Tax=Leifsonia xyli TaxID=1575 RepID=UPI003D67A81B